MGFDDFIDFEVFYEPAYWILVGGSILALMLGFGGAGMFSTEGAYIPFYTKIILFIAIFPVAYVLVKWQMSK